MYKLTEIIIQRKTESKPALGRGDKPTRRTAAGTAAAFITCNPCIALLLVLHLKVAAEHPPFFYNESIDSSLDRSVDRSTTHRAIKLPTNQAKEINRIEILAF